MSDHTTALVPVGSWCYHSPDVRAVGSSVDIGLIAEALIYYDSLLVNVANPLEFSHLINWFESRNYIHEFLALVKDGSIKLYEYSFSTASILKDGAYSIWHFVHEGDDDPNTFEKRYRGDDAVLRTTNNYSLRDEIFSALRGNVIEAKSDGFSNVIDNAIADFRNPERNALVLQAFVDELYSFRKAGKPPIVRSVVRPTAQGSQHDVTYNIDFNKLAALAGESLNFHQGTPLIASGVSNRLLWSAATLSCDMFLGRPISVLVGDKLYESGEVITRSHDIVDELKKRVMFPDLRSLVNNGRITFDEVLKIRSKSRKFRDWLQQESDRDQDAIVAYHHEVAKASGYTKTSRKMLQFFGFIGGPAVGSALGSLGGPGGAILGGVIGGGVSYLFDVASRLSSDWQPVVFGNWYKERIETVLSGD